VVLERRLLADKADDLALSRQVLAAFRGDSKPLEEEVELGGTTMRGTLHWRIEPSAGGHLAQNMEAVDRDLNSRSFAWVVPLISTWPPSILSGPEAQDRSIAG
jgi:hypothetical protein